MINEEIRSYEVSIWTLQDEFITVLKWSDIEQKGRIQEPKMTLNIDGTEKFEFSIPMYIYDQGKRIENPNWYNTRNGNLMASLRKIKVIFNKNNENKKVYEFLIMNMEETHEKDNLICNIQCEGLAFHELGKIGYKYNLSKDVFELDKKSYDEKGYWLDMNRERVYDEPFQTVNYWCDKVRLEPYPDDEAEVRSNVWYYKILMDWTSFEANLSTENDNEVYTLRDSSKVYEETYPKSWNTETLTPTEFEHYREKHRPVFAENSNIYNITQSIAEAFEIFCRYEYGHDENNNITSRTVIFYNNFIQEGSDGVSLTYPYSSSKVVRRMDSQDLTTKLYVLSVDDASTLRGYNTIMNSEANATREDYILNFDYLYTNKIISEDQYEAIKPYEIKMREYNDQLIIKQQQLETYQTQKPEYEAKLAFYQKCIEKDTEVKNTNSALAAELTGGTGYLAVTKDRPDYCLIHTDKNGKNYIELTSTNKGILKNSVILYHDYESANHKFHKRLRKFYFETDDYNFPYRIRGSDIKPDEDLMGNSKHGIYAIYKYKPKLYYDTIIETWNQKLADDTLEKEKYEELLGTKDESTGEGISGLYKLITDTENEIIEIQKNKERDIRNFERMMGPALREGYWQPEDYTDYGDQLQFIDALRTRWSSENKEIFLGDTGTSGCIGWDEKLFDEEEKLYYEQGERETQVYYPCIKLSRVYNQISDSINDYTFIFNSNGYMTAIDEDGDGEEETIDINDIRYVTEFALGSKVLLRFLRYAGDNSIIPVLMIVGAKTMTQDDINFMKRNTSGSTYGGNPRLAKIKTNEDGTVSVSDDGLLEFADDNIINFNANDFIGENDMPNYEIVYPRIKFSSLDLKTSSSDITIRYNDVLLEVAKDYYTNTRNTERLYNNEIIYYPEYYITIKPESIYSCGTLNGDFEVLYSLSNANTAIYLDALKVSKENSEPKVEYEVTATILNREMISTLYNKLAHIVMINDSDLKFNNIFGYISGLELDLDDPSEDTIEVKNYKTKFEDLFSNIVAQTEEMKKSGAGFIDAASGNVSLQEGAIMATIENNNSILSAYLDSHFDSSQFVIDRLKSLFTEAGQILGDSGKTLDSMRALSISNAEILNGFAENIAAQLSAHVYRQTAKPSVYKPGDQWIDDDNNYWVATGYSNDSRDAGDTTGFVKTYYGTLASITGTGMNVDAEKGVIDIKAKTEINLLTTGEQGDVNIAAGRAVHITGNKDVTIGGPTINIAADAATPLLGSGAINIVSSGINFNPTATDLTVEEQMEQMISSDTWAENITYRKGRIVIYDNAYYKCNTDHTSGSTFNSSKWDLMTNISKVLINPHSIEMASADISMKGANKIQMVTSLGSAEGTSAISISSDDGVWIGSGRGIRLFSGNVDYNSNTNQINWSHWNASGASIELNSEHLLLGYANTNTNDANAIEMTKEYVIIASGDMIKQNEWEENTTYSVGDLITYNDFSYRCKTAHPSGETFDSEKWETFEAKVTGTTGGLVGAKFTKESIGFATENNGSINAILMNDDGITVGSGNVNVTLPTVAQNQGDSDLRSSSGSYVRINGEGIELGALADLYINTDNFKLQTHSREINTNDKYTLLAIGGGLQNIGTNTAVTMNDDGTATAGANVQLLLNQNGMYIKGNIYASTLYAKNSEDTSYFKADSAHFGFYKIGKDENDNDIEKSILTIAADGLTCNEHFTIAADDLTLTVNSSNVPLSNYAISKVNTLSGIIIQENLVKISSSSSLVFESGGALSITANETNKVTLNSNGIFINTDGGFQVNSGGSIKVNSNGNIKVIGGTISLKAQASDDDDTNSITLNGNGLYAIGKRIYLGSKKYANRTNGNYLEITQNGINIQAPDGALKINNKPVWSQGDIIYSYEDPHNNSDITIPTDRPWLWVKPIGEDRSKSTWSGSASSSPTLSGGSTLSTPDSGGYTYVFTATTRIGYGSTTAPYNGCSLSITLTNTTTNVQQSFTITGVNYASGSGGTAKVTKEWTSNNKNLFGNGGSIRLNISGQWGSANISATVTSATIEGSCEKGATGGSQCIVYYFPG